MNKIISLKSGAETPSLYENAEAIVLFLCRECVDHIRNLYLPEEVFDLIGYQVGKQGYAFTEMGKVTSMLVKTEAVISKSFWQASEPGRNVRRTICVLQRGMP